MSFEINCDMGESFGIYNMGDDEAIMPYITQANVACGFHASDPNHMSKTIALAKAHNVKIGAHFSLPDLAGFGRREMKIGKEEMTNIIIYQVGALQGFLTVADCKLNHLKAHGALYGMATSYKHIAEAIADVGEYFKVPIFGIAGTILEEICISRGLEFVSEFFADLEYADDGSLVIVRKHHLMDIDYVAQRCTHAIKNNKIKSINGVDIDVRVETICVHSDTPNAVDVAKVIHDTCAKITT